MIEKCDVRCISYSTRFLCAKLARFSGFSVSVLGQGYKPPWADTAKLLLLKESKQGRCQIDPVAKRNHWLNAPAIKSCFYGGGRGKDPDRRWLWMSLTTPTRGRGFSRLRTDSTVSLPVIILFRLISAAINAPMFIPNFYFFFGCLISLALEHGARKAWKESKKSLPM